VSRKPIESRIETGGSREEGERGTVSPEAFREALSHWAATVTVVAVRDGGRVYGTTVTSFLPVSDDPARILVSLGPGAQVLPFLQEGAVFGVSFLGREQRRFASVFSDPYPVGPSPFPEDEEDAPLVQGAPVRLTCTVERAIPVEGNRLVLARVGGCAVDAEGEEAPLLYHRRHYRTLDS